MTFFLKCCATLLLAALICGCGVSSEWDKDPSSEGEKLPSEHFDINAYNDLWVVSTPSRFCVADADLQLNYCANDSNDPEYRFWIEANESDRVREKWLVKL